MLHVLVCFSGEERVYKAITRPSTLSN